MLRRLFVKGMAAAPLVSVDESASFESDAIEKMAVGPVPGAVIGMVTDGKPGWVRALGVLNTETRKPVDANSIFQAASLTKQVIAYAAFAMRAQGKLDFEKTLVSYVDDLKDSQARKVTIRQVLSHSSGFPNWRFEEGKPLVPEFEPGTRWQYSGEGYFYLQRILEAVSGKGICELTEELVFQPIGMNSTSLLWKPEWMDRTASPHNRNGEPRKEWDRRARLIYEAAAKKGQTVRSMKYSDYSTIGTSSLPNYIAPNGASSMVTSAADYGRFVAAAMKNPELRKEQIKVRRVLGWGLGWGIERIGNREFLWQWGDNGGYKNIVLAEPARGEAIFVFTNSDSGAKLYEWMVRNISGIDHPAFLRL